MSSHQGERVRGFDESSSRHHYFFRLVDGSGGERSQGLGDGARFPCACRSTLGLAGWPQCPRILRCCSTTLLGNPRAYAFSERLAVTDQWPELLSRRLNGSVPGKATPNI